MENAGAVTFTEHYLFRDPPTESQLSGRADTVLHEMAHMWFGDLVTMRWWTGLWLNESFATYMAALCVAEATQYGEASWVQFANRMKAWAYREGLCCEILGGGGPTSLCRPTAYDALCGARVGRGHEHGVPELRRHHVREGRERAEAARGGRGARRVPGRDARLHVQAQVGQHDA